MFFDDDLIENIVEQTNIYSMQQSSTSIATNKDEIEKYIGIIMTMSYVKLPTQRMYWTNRFRIPSIANLMTVKHFEKLKRYIHFNNNDDALPKTHKEFDKLFKIRPLIDSVLPKCQAIPTEEHHSIDEQIIPTKGRSGMRQYLPKKPNKWGIKVWARCGHSGILYDFEIYEGRKDKRDVNEIPGLLMGGGGGGGNVVYRLTRTLEKKKNFKIYIDNFFSSINLMVHLKKEQFRTTCTVRQDRLAGAKKHLSLRYIKAGGTKNGGIIDITLKIN